MHTDTLAAPVASRPLAPSAPAPVQELVSQQELLDVLGLFRPQRMADDVKVRIGGEEDGGYVMPSLALKAQFVLSIGIGDQVSFDLDLAQRGAKVLQFDHTIPGAPAVHDNICFHRLGWGPQDQGPLRSLRSMVAMADWYNVDHAVLKFDTEGAEWAALAACEESDLARFDVIAGEFHALHLLEGRSNLAHVRLVMSKLLRHHAPVHLHANNAMTIRQVIGVPVPPLLEVTFVRRDRVRLDGWCTDPIPGPLDRPNMGDRPDLCLRPF